MFNHSIPSNSKTNQIEINRSTIHGEFCKNSKSESRMINKPTIHGHWRGETNGNQTKLTFYPAGIKIQFKKEEKFGVKIGRN